MPDRSFWCENGLKLGTAAIRLFTSEYVETVNIVRKFAEDNYFRDSSRKIYVSHTLINSSLIGEEKVEQYFASKGYEIIHPETLSLDEQLACWINCSSFASSVGSCSHNVIFLRDNTEVILLPRSFGINPW